MIYKFTAYGHPNILANHKTTLEFTQDKELSLRGDCIIGINADFDLNKIKKLIKKLKNNKITIILQTVQKNKNNKKVQEKINAEFNPNFNSDKEFVVRKTDFVSERTFAIRANKAAFDLNRDLIEFLKKKRHKVNIVIENRK